MRNTAALVLASVAGLIGATFTPALAGAAYRTLPLANAAACARACADDGLCIVWVQRPQGGCELSATAPSAWPADGSAVGLSSRAPDFISLPSPTSPAASAAPEGTSGNADVAEVSDDAVTAEAEDYAPGYALLGGPDEDALRLSRSQ